ncbi:MAG: hypothetical protein GY909_10280 [Oligoflexia bacterium]|nr:hypothetical protein [Oligoflexia bacterium]
MKMTRRKNLIAYTLIVLSLFLAGGCSTKVVNNYYLSFPNTEKAANYSNFADNVAFNDVNLSALSDVQYDDKGNQIVEEAILIMEPIKTIGNKIVAKVGGLTLKRDTPFNFDPLPVVEKKPAIVISEIPPETAVPVALIFGGVSFMFLARNRRKRADLTELTEDEWRGLKFFWKFLEGSLKKRGKL